MRNDFQKSPIGDMGIAISTTIILIIFGILFGYFPSIKAVKIKQIEELMLEQRLNCNFNVIYLIGMIFFNHVYQKNITKIIVQTTKKSFSILH